MGQYSVTFAEYGYLCAILWSQPGQHFKRARWKMHGKCYFSVRRFRACCSLNLNRLSHFSPFSVWVSFLGVHSVYQHHISPPTRLSPFFSITSPPHLITLTILHHHHPSSPHWPPSSPPSLHLMFTIDTLGACILEYFKLVLKLKQFNLYKLQMKHSMQLLMKLMSDVYMHWVPLWI